MRRTMRFALASVLSVSACDDGTGPKDDVDPVENPVTVRLELETPAADDAAVLLTLVAPTAPEVVSTPYPWAFSERSSGVLRVVLLGGIGDGALLRVSVEEAEVDRLVVSIEQVAGADNTLRDDLTGYSVAVAAE